MMSDISNLSWPAIEYENHEWVSSVARQIPRSAQKRHRGPYQAAVPTKISKRSVWLPSDLAALVEEAATTVTRFDAELGYELAPFSAVLLRSESTASSKIENLTASARAIGEAELGVSGNNASLIVANTRAMNAAVELAHRIDADAILQMHAALLDQSQPQIAGRWRDEQVWIGGSDYGPHGATFVAPHHARVVAAIEDLLEFIKRDDVPTLAHAALAHAQFETIHPFPDGNGRTGRALIHAHLRNKGLTRNVTVPVSAGILTDTDTYFDALTEYREGNYLSIIERLSLASFSAVENGRQLVSELRTVRAEWDERIHARKDSRAWQIADLLLRHPVINAALISRELGIHGANIYRILEPLIKAQVLEEFTDKKRNMMWRADEVLVALDAFAMRAGRRVRSTEK